MIEQLRNKIERLNDVGEHAFNGTDYSFGFNTWKSGTLTLLRRLIPAMIGIRNPKAHANLYPDENKAIHFLFLASFMFVKLQEAGIINEI